MTGSDDGSRGARTCAAEGQRPSGDWSQQGTMPTGHTGRALILGVWDIADTGNAFYSCADVDFG